MYIAKDLSDGYFLSISQKLDGFTGADLQSVVREAGLVCVERGGDKLSVSDFDTALGLVKRSVSDKDLEYYTKQ